MSIQEDLDMHRLATELRTSFPTATSLEIDLLLGDLRDTFRNAPIREFLPVLIRRAARDHLAGRAVFSSAQRRRAATAVHYARAWVDASALDVQLQAGPDRRWP